MEREEVERQVRDSLEENRIKKSQIYNALINVFRDKFLTEGMALIKDQENAEINESVDGSLIQDQFSTNRAKTRERKKYGQNI